MHCTYYFFEHLIPELKSQVVGLCLLDCFSQNKNELIISFANEDKETHLLVNLSNNFNCLAVKPEFKKAKSKFQNHFKQAVDKTVIDLVLQANDRVFYFLLEDHSKLVFKMYGNRSNVIFINPKEEVEQLFVNKLRGDLEFKIEPKEKENFQIDDTSLPNQVITSLGKEVNQYFIEQGWNEWDATIKEQELKNYINGITSSPKFLLLETTRPSLLINPHAGLSSAIEATNELFHRLSRNHYFTEPKKKALNGIRKQIKQTKSYLKKVYLQLQQFDSDVSFKEKADVLMANLHLVTETEKEYSLDNFYGGNPILVTLKKNEKPQDIATKWYKKDKNRHLEKNKLEENISIKEDHLLELEERQIQVEEVSSTKALLKLTSAENTSSQKTFSKFKETSFGGFDIYIGRNSRNNDELLKFAKKDDIWLHAKDVAGSHVLIKLNNSTVAPKSVLEYAASLAAYYSKRKTDSICPVIYTPKKYVRKRKGLLPGQVMVDREQVILVEPKGLNE